MNNFTLPFSIEPAGKDYVLSKLYEEKKESYLLKIKKDAKPENPIIIRIKPTVNKIGFHLKIHLEENADATIIEEWDSDIRPPEITFQNEIICDNNANLSYVILNYSSSETSLAMRRTTEIGNNAKCHIYAYHFGGKKIDNYVLQKTTGKTAGINTDIITKPTGKQEFNFHTEHIYTEKEGFGEISMKGIAEGEAILSFNGMVNIARTANGSSGHLNQETLNLSENTVVKAVPELKIDTNDVKAGHSASIRNLNDEDLYYFGARGIAKDEAKRLLITGFIGKELQKIQNLAPAYETIKKLI